LIASASTSVAFAQAFTNFAQSFISSAEAFAAFASWSVSNVKALAASAQTCGHFPEAAFCIFKAIFLYRVYVRRDQSVD